MRRLLILTLIVMSVTLMFAAEQVVLSSDGKNEVKVLSSNDYNIALEYKLGSFLKSEIEIDGDTYFQLHIEGEAFLLKAGEPELPYITRSVIVPNSAKMGLYITEMEYEDFTMQIAPSKGNLLRNQNPADVPYTFSDVYSVDSFYPESIKELSDPYILRDFRGQTIRISPFQFNPVTNTLRVYKKVKVVLRNEGQSDINVLDRDRNGYNREFKSIYKNHFINMPLLRYDPLPDRGRIIVISHDSFMPAVQPYLDWKRQKGIDTEIYPISGIGNNANSIKAFIQQQYDLNDNLTFVQLVGDAAQIATFMVGGGGSDPSYTLLAGNDNYPDIFVGRFSAETIAQVENQVQKSISYERDATVNDDWYAKATGIASSEGSPPDWQHLNEIRLRLLAHNYTEVDQFYQPNATSTMVTTAVNAGRGFMNYTGHGSTTSWSTSGFSNTHVNNLVNDDKLPFIVSVACVNGNFTSSTCFAEAWLRATNNNTGAPTGAVAMYASTVNQSWYPPMAAQDEIADLLNEEIITTIGGLFFNGSLAMIEQWGNQGVTEFKAWTIFGDASLQVRSNTPEELIVLHNENMFIGLDNFTVSTDIEGALVSLSQNNEIIAAGYTNSNGYINLILENPPVEATEYTLTVSAQNKVTYIAAIEVIGNMPLLMIDEVEVTGSYEGRVIYDDLAIVNISLKNYGFEPASQVTAVLSSQSPFVEVIDNTQSFGDIVPEQIVYMANSYTIKIADNVPDQHQITMNIAISDNEEGSWNDSFSFTVAAPRLEVVDFFVDDGQTGNGFIDPGEHLTLYLPIKNIGSAVSPYVVFNAFNENDLLNINSINDSYLGVIHIDETVYIALEISVSEIAEAGNEISFSYSITAHNYSFDGVFSTIVGGMISTQIGSGENSNPTSAASPVNTYYRSIRTQTVYTRDEIIDAGGIPGLTLIQLGYYVTQPSNYPLPNFLIRMKHTTATDASEHDNGTFTQVYSTPSYIPTEGGWDMLTFSTPFAWNGVDNILVDTAFSQTTNWHQSGQLRVYSQTNGMRFVRSDSGNMTNANTDSISSNKPQILFRFGFSNDESLVKPDNLTAVYSQNTIQLEWDEFVTMSRSRNSRNSINTSRNLLGFNVYRNGILLNNNYIQQSQYTDAGIEERVNYHYFVTAVYTGGESQPSNVEAIRFAANPVFSHNPGTYDDPIMLTLYSDLEDAVIRYTLNGSEPNSNSPVYTGNPISIHTSNNIVKAIAVKEGWIDSEIVSAEYTIINTNVDEEMAAAYPTELRNAYPNPFNPSTKISYSLNREGYVSIEVYNIIGQKIAVLVDEVKKPGSHSTVWYGLNNEGRKVSSGVYFYRMQTDDFSQIKKLIYLK